MYADIAQKLVTLVFRQYYFYTEQIMWREETRNKPKT